MSESSPSINAPQLSGPEKPVIHNLWTIYTLDPAQNNGVEHFAVINHRPPEWGDPKYTYRTYEGTQACPGGNFITKERVIIHCWHDKPLTDEEHWQLFGQLVMQTYRPGAKPEKCGREYLAEGDVWDETWGPYPLDFWDEDEDEYR